MAKQQSQKLREFAVLLFLATFLVFSSTAQITLSFNIQNPTCHAYTNGNIAALPMGGVAPYSYLWSNGQGGQTTFGVSAGNYEVTVTDIDGLSTVGSVLVEEPDLLTVAIDVLGDECLGTNGTIQATPAGGTPPYNYLWNTGATTQVMNDMEVGFYIVTVTDANGCKATMGKAMNLPLSVNVETTDVLCNGWCDGAAKAVITGGKQPYTFLWNTGATTQIIDMLPVATFTVTVTDGDGCTAVGSGSVGEPPAIIFAVDVSDNCNSNVNINVAANGGQPPLSYQWLHGPTTPNLTGLSEGYYYLTITDSKGCEADTFVVISDGIDINAFPNPAACEGVDNGSVTVEVPNGIGPLTFHWSTGAVTSEKTLTDLVPGNYSVTVVDGANCSTSTAFEIEAAEALQPMTNSTQGGCGTACIGTATVTDVVGGVAPFIYKWSDNANNQTTSTATNLCPGTYQVTITDANDCEVVASVTVNESQSDVALAMTSVMAGCGNTCNGTATVSTTAGSNPPFVFQWDNNANNQVGATALNLCPGEYFVTVTDNVGCTAVASVAVLESPADMGVSIGSTLASCADVCNGTASVNVVSGGLAPFTYQWDDNANNQITSTAIDLCAGAYSVTVTDSLGCTMPVVVNVGQDDPISILIQINNASCHNTPDGEATVVLVSSDAPPFEYTWSDGQIEATASDLLPGIYQVTVTDSLGCEGVVDVSVASESSITAQWEWEIDTCMGDSILVTFSDASIFEPASDVVMTWEWMFSPGSTFNTPTATFYVTESPIEVQLIVTNAVGCVDTLSQMVDVDVFSCTLPFGDTTVCENDELMLGIDCISDDPNLMIQWSPDSLILTGGNTSTPTINTAEPGTYLINVSISSDIGCTRNNEVTVMVADTSLQLDPNQITFEQSCDTLEVCFFNQNPTDLMNFYTWFFDYPNTTPSIDTAFQPCHIYGAPGEYVVALIPNVDCKDTIFIPITVEEIPEAFFNFTIIDDCTEAVTINFDDLSTPISDVVSWDWEIGDSLSNEQNPNIVITDSTQILDVALVVGFGSGCVDTFTQQVIARVFTPLIPSDTVLTCVAGEPVALNSGGDSTLLYLWSPANCLDDPTAWNPIATVADPKLFTVTMTDTLTDCELTKEVLVDFPPPINLQVEPTSIVACEIMDTILTAGTAVPVDFMWATDSDFDNVIDTTHALTVSVGDSTSYFLLATDEYGCMQQLEIPVGNYEIVLGVPDAHELCFGESIDFDIVGVQDDYEVIWTPFDPIGIVPADSTSFDLLVTNSQGCQFEKSLSINVINVEDALTLVPEIDTIVRGDRVQLLATENPSYIYEWTNTEFLTPIDTHNPIAAPDETTTFELTVTTNDTLQCRGTAESFICVISDLCDYPMIFFPNAFTPNGDGLNDVLYVEGFNIDQVFFAIYNRWGEKVFESHSQSEGWDGTYQGKPASGDVFAYYLRVTCLQGGQLSKQGNVTVIR